ncbi:hypothetical protein [Anaerosalibacter sp. Marseille-P3206]|uniref:hypothetical protein n=1 Tax=Anaerosalibacter sp. Marseille-P3206 TaxID=1871005 RepID=UPI0009858E6B|nr:hypothetical protein [Anaerosalibacter sp. Marseille-P3206]
MTIGEIIRYKDINTYRKLTKMCSKKIDKPKKEIELGDTVENLMQHDSYRREGRRLKQTKWG